MKRGWALGLAAVVIFGSAALLEGCLLGPEPGTEHLLVSRKWKHKRARPVQLDRDFEYRGEPFEEAYFADELDEGT